MNKLPHILICDDDPVVHESLGLYLSYEGYPYTSAYDGEDALKQRADLVAPSNELGGVADMLELVLQGGV